MLSRSRTLWLLLLLLCAAAAPRAFDVQASADGWEQLDDTRFEAVPLARSVPVRPATQQLRAPEGEVVTHARLAEAEIFRPPIS